VDLNRYVPDFTVLPSTARPANQSLPLIAQESSVSLSSRR
jgi:hypothetical protein